MADNDVFPQKRIEIYLSQLKLRFISNHRGNMFYPIAAGKPSTPTPTGTYKVINKIINPGGILGTRWLGLNIPDGPYGIHGTFKPETIGKYISNGCIRMYNHDIEELFPMIYIGTTVLIYR